ncbi:MarR family winged helix-turn-helix transcriptional regulator [Agromyces aurantiacus]|uniref:MarR family winged helix-turn-helix transcriptional regulator n=1 Tax=Agromyces aurantiacus TaxID=165814 RepID=A0ABV9R2M9_9MICO|nr:MarR family transcriptional regulator [Agromyces aurantiacus]MBM7506168.1 DNA-binding MarR family transcriptional regulator [Agromyces aurantiacus]
MSVDLPSLISLAAGALEQRVLDRLAAAGHPALRVAHGYVFQVLLVGETSVTELGRRLGITQQGASKTVSELERLGYVARRPDPSDARARRLALTDRARDAIAVARDARAEFVSALEARIGADRVQEAALALEAATELLGIDHDIRLRSVRMPAGQH